LVLAWTLALGLGWWLITPPWAAPDEPGHFLYARVLADRGLWAADGNIDRADETALIASLLAWDWWGYNRRQTPEPSLARLADDPVLAASGVQIGSEPRLYYVVPALALRWMGERARGQPAAALRWLRLWSLMLRLLTVSAALALADRAWPQHPRRRLGLGLLVGGLPMVGFIGGSMNNDALAMFWGALGFALLALARSRGGWLLAGVVILAGPIFVDRGLLFLWPVALLWLSFTHFPARVWRMRALLALAALALLALAPNPHWAAGWRRFPANATSRSVEGLMLAPRGTETARVAQYVGGKELIGLDGKQLLLKTEVWGEENGWVKMRLADKWSEAVGRCPIQKEPRACTLPFVVQGRSGAVRVEIMADQPAHVRLRLLDEDGRDWLFNGDGRLPDALAGPLFMHLEKTLPIPAGFFARAMAPSAWDAVSQLRYLIYMAFTWASFWGYFGWLTRPLPWPVYALLAALTLAAGAGAARLFLRTLARARRGPLSTDDRLLALSLLALAAILAQTWLPMLGQSWQPQGRYLFPALLPIAILLLRGWETLWPSRHRSLFIPLLAGGLFALNLVSWWIII